MLSPDTLWLTPRVVETAHTRVQASRLIREAHRVLLWVPLRQGENSSLVDISKQLARAIVSDADGKPLPEISFEDETLYLGDFRMPREAYRV